jgi:hypothetical protein
MGRRIVRQQQKSCQLFFSPCLRASVVRFCPLKTQTRRFRRGEFGKPASLRLRESSLVLLFDAVEFCQQMMIRICLQLF